MREVVDKVVAEQLDVRKLLRHVVECADQIAKLALVSLVVHLDLVVPAGDLIDGVGEVVSRFQPQLGGRGGEDHAEKEREQQCDDKIPDLRVPREPRDEFVQNQADGCRDGGRCRHERDKEEHEGEPYAPPRMPLLIFFFHG